MYIVYCVKNSNNKDPYFMIHRLLQSLLSYINKSVIGQLLRKYTDAVLWDNFFS